MVVKRFASVRTSSKSGVARIKRDGYATTSGMTKKNSWWDIRKEVYARDGGMCVFCRRVGRLVKATDVHHIVPLSRGGTTTKSNLVSVCDCCHEKRHPGNKHLSTYHRSKK
jgi:5-methylcytosine-specific restriction endonuclease McrA